MLVFEHLHSLVLALSCEAGDVYISRKYTMCKDLLKYRFQNDLRQPQVHFDGRLSGKAAVKRALSNYSATVTRGNLLYLGEPLSPTGLLAHIAGSDRELDPWHMSPYIGAKITSGVSPPSCVRSSVVLIFAA